MGTLLSQIFRDSAAKLYQSFPEQLDRLVILVDTLATPVFVPPAFADELSENTRAVKSVLAETFPPEKPTTYGTAWSDYEMGGCLVDIVAFKEGLPSVSGISDEMLRVFVFDHELGHLVVEGGMSDDGHHSELAADAYAALRHIQRYGMNTGFFDFYNRANMVVLGQSPAHYTTSAMESVWKMAQERDVSKLSLKETAELAAKIAQQSSADMAEVCRISQVYSPIIETYNKCRGDNQPSQWLYKKDNPLWAPVFKEIATVMKNFKNDPAVFKAGLEFLSHPDRKKDIQQRAENDSYWKDVLTLIEPPEKKGRRKFFGRSRQGAVTP